MFMAFGWKRVTSKDKQNNPKYTSTYTIHLQQGIPYVLKPKDEAAGFMIISDPDRPRCKMVVKKWLQDGVCCGVPYQAGDYVLTWQFISQTQVASYNILANPVYAPAMAALLDGRDLLHMVSASAMKADRQCTGWRAF